jgi:hypothetical protein
MRFPYAMMAPSANKSAAMEVAIGRANSER